MRRCLRPLDIRMTLRRRFYKEVSLTPQLGIALDRKPVRTPGKRFLVLPNAELAAGIAGEWESQAGTIKPASMPLTKLANAAIDRVAPERKRIIAEIIDYAGSDLVCYRAEGPQALVERQVGQWNPILAWARSELEVSLKTFTGVVHRPQPNEALESLGRIFAAADDFTLTGLYNIMTLTGSVLLALMLARGRISPDDAWPAAHVDEDFQIEHWGEDEEARDRRENRRKEFDACCRFIKLAAP